MARVTIEKCLENVEGHFELILLAAQRAKYISQNISNSEKNSSKPSVLSLREIEENKIEIEDLRKDIIKQFQSITEEVSEEEISEELVEELQSSEFIHGEVESISEGEELFTEIEEEVSK